MTKTTYTVTLNTGDPRDTYRMSSMRAAIAAAAAEATGGTVTGSDGSVRHIAHETPRVLRYQSLGNFDDGGLT